MDNDKNGNGKSRKPKGLRKDKRVQITFTDGLREDGKPNRISFYGKTRAEAEQKRDEYKKKRALGINLDADKLTACEWIDTWFTTYKSGLRGTNRKSHEYEIAALKKHLGSKMLMRDVRNVHLQAFFNELMDKSSSAISKRKMILEGIFSKARINKLIIDDPSEGLDKPRAAIKERKHRALDRSETDIIMQHWQLYPRFGLAIMLMLLTGIRRGEAVPLHWGNDIDLENRQIYIHAAAEADGNRMIIKPYTKTDAGMRTLPICDPLYDALLTVPKAERTGYVCKPARGNQLSLRGLDRGLEGFLTTIERHLNGEPLVAKRKNKQERELEARLAAEAEATGQKKERIVFSFMYHDLRYTFATALYDAGVPVKAAQYYLGHSDVKTTLDLYTQLSRERERASRAALTTYLDSWLNRDLTVENALENGTGGQNVVKAFPELHKNTVFR